jgi:hypothetical protein
VATCYEHSNENVVSIKDVQFLEQLKNYKFLEKEDYTPSLLNSVLCTD